jgi:uracil phosphoribosyltransferase
VKHWLAVARNAATPTPIFRSALAELGRILIYEAVREFLPTVDGVIDTPMGPADVTCVDPMRPVKVCAALPQQQKQNQAEHIATAEAPTLGYDTG